MKRVLFKGRPFYIPEAVAIDDAIPLMNKANAHADIANQMWKENDVEIASLTRAGQYKIFLRDDEIKIYILAETFDELERTVSIYDEEEITFEVRLALLDPNATDRIDNFEYSWHSFSNVLPDPGEKIQWEADIQQQVYIYTEDNGTEVEMTFKRLEVSDYYPVRISSNSSYSWTFYDYETMIWQLQEFSYRRCGTFPNYIWRDPLITTGPGMNIIPALGLSCYYDEYSRVYRVEDLFETLTHTVGKRLYDAGDGRTLETSNSWNINTKIFEFVRNYLIPDHYENDFGWDPNFTGNCSRNAGWYQLVDIDLDAPDDAVFSAGGDSIYCDFGYGYVDPSGTRHLTYLWERDSDGFSYNLTVDQTTWLMQTNQYVEGVIWFPVCYTWQSDIFIFNGSAVSVFCFTEIYGFNSPPTDGCITRYGIVYQGVLYEAPPIHHVWENARDLQSSDGIAISKYFAAIGVEIRKRKKRPALSYVLKRKNLDYDEVED